MLCATPLLSLGLLLGPSPTATRRELLQLPLLALPVAALPASAASKPATLESVKVLAAKAKALRSTVRTSSAGRRNFPMVPDTNNYSSQTKAVERAQQVVLLPLLAAMKAVAPTITLSDAEMQKQLKEQAIFMKGHLLELDTALKGYKFDEYVSKTTGETYLGGKVERELQEVCETAEDFIALASGRPVEARDGVQ
tara:strand:- start:592 stop:1179 length:588 start_codon:yes stop_codon:yes gene_type:complete